MDRARASRASLVVFAEEACRVELVGFELGPFPAPRTVGTVRGAQSTAQSTDIEDWVVKPGLELSFLQDPAKGLCRKEPEIPFAFGHQSRDRCLTPLRRPQMNGKKSVGLARL